MGVFSAQIFKHCSCEINQMHVAIFWKCKNDLLETAHDKVHGNLSLPHCGKICLKWNTQEKKVASNSNSEMQCGH